MPVLSVKLIFLGQGLSLVFLVAVKSNFWEGAQGPSRRTREEKGGGARWRAF